MATSKSISAESFLKPFTLLVKNSHLTLFFAAVVVLLVFAVIIINQTLTNSERESQGYTSSINAGSIDEATLLRLQSLQTSSEPGAEVALPEGRINPFSE